MTEAPRRVQDWQLVGGRALEESVNRALRSKNSLLITRLGSRPSVLEEGATNQFRVMRSICRRQRLISRVAMALPTVLVNEINRGRPHLGYLGEGPGLETGIVDERGKKG